jgi:hypothetical protein
MNATRNTLSASARKKAVMLLNSAVADLLTDVLRDLNKQLWILEAHLNKK